MKILITLFIVCGIYFSNASFSQCNTNNTICAQGTAGPFEFVSGSENPVNCLGWLSNSQYAYIVLYITSSGPLNLLIQGDVASGFLDVSIYAIPNGANPCNSLVPANLIGCNFAAASGGCNEFGTAFGCSSSLPAPNVIAGQQLMIIVEDHGNGPSNNFTLQLAPAPAAQTGPPAANITPVGPFCQNSASTQLIAASMGGTWTGPGVSASGLFDPATAGPGTHTINYSIGQVPCNSASNTTIIVTPSPTVTVDNVTSCSGQSATLTATPSIPGGTYVWTPAGNGTNNTINVTPLTSTSYSVIYTVAGCSSSSASGIVSINSLPTFNLIGTAPTICNASDGFITITGLAPTSNYSVNYNDDGIPISIASVMSNAAGTIIISNLNWGAYSNFSITLDGCTGTNATTVNLSNSDGPSLNSPGAQTACLTYALPLITGANLSGNQAYYTNSQALGGTPITGNITSTQTVWIYDTNGPCSAEISFLVTINTTPTVTVNNPSICSGASVDITAIPAIPGGTFLWSTTETNQTISVSPITTTTYTVIYSVNNCPSLPVSSNVTVIDLPIVTVNNPIICVGDIATITATPQIAGGSYLWMGGETTQSITASPIVTTNYIVTYTLNSCTSLPITSTINVTPTPDPSGGSDKTICSNTPGNIGVNSSASFTYLWSPSTGLNSSTSSSPSITLTNNTLVPASYVYTVTATSPSGCFSVDEVTVTVNPIPTSSFTADTLTGCSPLKVMFVTNSSIANSTYNWDFGDGLASTIINDSVVHTYFSSGCYDVSLTSTINSCSSSVTVPQMICVLETPVADFSVNQPFAYELQPNFSFMNYSTQADLYNWDFGDTTFSAQSDPIHTYQGYPGDYTVILIAKSDDGCSDTVQKTITIREELIYYIPNCFTPDENQFNQTFQPVFTSGFDPYNFVLLIYNKWGEIIFETHDAKIGWDGSYGGKLVQDGWYVWKLEFRDPYSDKVFTDNGFVNVLK